MTDHAISIGCCAFCFGSLGLADALRLVRGLGFTRVSIGVNHPNAQVNPLAAAAEPLRIGAQIRELCARDGLEPIEFFMCPLHIDAETSVVPNHPDKAVRGRMLEQFKRVCDCTAAAGFHNLMGVPGTPQETLDNAAEWGIAVETLNRMVAVAHAAGVRFTIEPHRGSIIHDVALVKRMLAEVPGLLLTLDYAHFVGKGVPEEELFGLHAHTAHLHARPARPGAYTCAVDENMIDFGKITAALRHADWRGTISTECFGAATTEQPLGDHPSSRNLLMARVLEDALGAALH